MGDEQLEVALRRSINEFRADAESRVAVKRRTLLLASVLLLGQAMPGAQLCELLLVLPSF